MRAMALDILVVGAADPVSALDHRAFPVAAGRVALAMLAARPFDAVLVVGEPADMPAAELVGKIRGAALGRVAMTPVIAVAHAAVTNALVAAGADEVLPVPLAPEPLARVLGQLVCGEQNLEAELGGVRLEQLLRLFLDTLRDQVRRLDEAGLSNRDLAAIAHRLKGAAANFGYDELAHVADRAMWAAESDDHGIAGQRGLLKLCASAVIVAVEARLAGGASSG